MEIKIRQYCDDDFEQVFRLIDDFQNLMVEIDTRKISKPFDSLDCCKKYLNQLLMDCAEREGIFYLALDNEKIIGFVQGIIDRHKDDTIYTLTHTPGAHGWIGELYIEPEYREQGIGKQLIEEIAEYFKENGCVNVRLNAMSDNIKAIAAYEKLGFVLRNVEMVKFDL